MSDRAILLLAHGSPDSPEQVPEFLQNVAGGRPLPPHVVAEVKHRYGLIGRSPLTEITLKQGEALAHELGVPVYVGMRNWHPFISDTIKKMTADGVRHALAICLAPQNSRTSVGLYHKSVKDAAPSFDIDYVDEWHDQPSLIAAFAEKLRAGWERASQRARTKLPVIFTAHSVPTRTIEEGDPYERQARETAELVARQVPQITEWKFAFQSQGMSGGAWLGPTVEETIRELKQTDHRGVFIQPIGFLCDHVEVLYDIDVLFREFAEKEGLHLWRADSLNDSPLLIRALAELSRARLPKSAAVK